MYIYIYAYIYIYIYINVGACFCVFRAAEDELLFEPLAKTAPRWPNLRQHESKLVPDWTNIASR